MNRPPYQYGGEYYPNERRRGGNVCVRCICCCYCCLFFIILIFAAITLYTFVYYNPKWPSYKFESVDVKEFMYRPDSSINADLILTLKADNPNKAIALVYEEASSINVTYKNSMICSGKFPSFHQGHKNISMLQIQLTGKNQLSSGIYESLKDDERHEKIPLDVAIKVPVRLVVGDLKVKHVINVFLNVTLTVHDLKLGKKPQIEEGKFMFKYTA